MPVISLSPSLLKPLFEIPEIAESIVADASRPRLRSRNGRNGRLPGFE